MIGAGLIAAGSMTRRHVVRTIEREYAESTSLDASGIVRGAESFTLRGTGTRGLLLLHGFGDSPQSLRYLAERLHGSGYTVHVPLLPGHGRTPHDFAGATADDYITEARKALAELRGMSAWIGLVGLSMGGALAARLADESGDARALVLLAPYVIPPELVRWTARLAWLWSPFAPYLRGRGAASVHDEIARDESKAYGSVSGGALKALVETAAAGRRVLPQLHVPTLVVNSEQDNRIPRAHATTALSELGGPVEERWVTGCGHVITVDYCKAKVAELVLAFLARHAD
jgi:carboxylesterase